MRRWLMLPVLAAAIFPAQAAAAERLAWTRPVTLQREVGGDLLFAYFVSTPSGRRTVLVDSGTEHGIKVFPRRKGARFGAPIAVPGDRGSLSEGVAINDSGAMAFGWTDYAQDPPANDEDDPCWCRPKAVVRRASGRFGPVARLDRPAAAQYAPWVDIDEHGAATAIWKRWRALRVAFAGPVGPFRRSRTVAKPVDDYLIDYVNRHVLLRWPIGRQWYEARSPFVHSHRTRDPGYGFFEDGTAIAGDERGNELLVSATGETRDVTVRYRRAGGSFGPPRTIARAGRVGALCDVGAVMNRRGEVFAAWDCDPSGAFGEGSYAQGAYLSRTGHLRALSRRHPALSAGLSMGISLDDRGRALAAWQAPSYDVLFSLVGAHHRFLGFPRIARGPVDDAMSVDVMVAHGGLGLATWYDWPSGKRQRVRVASIRLPR